MDCSLPGSSVHGISQARISEWVAISFSRGSSTPRDRTCLLHCKQILYHLSHQGSPHLFLMLNNIPMSGYTTRLFIYSPTERHLGCFHLLVIMISYYKHLYADFCMDVSFQLTWVSCQREKLLDHIVRVCLALKEAAKLPSKVPK